MLNENNVTISNYKQELKTANKLLLAKSDAFSERNIDQAKSVYKQILSLGMDVNAMSIATAKKMLRLLEVLEKFLVSAHRNNKADIQSVADILYYNKFYFNDCYKDLLNDLDEAIFYWYDKAALLGSASAFLKRARLFLYGSGVKQSVIEALDSYKQASEGSKDAWAVWNSVKNNKMPSRLDLVDEVNIIKFYLYCEGIYNYEQNFEKAKEAISNLTDVTITEPLKVFLSSKIESNEEKVIDEAIFAKSKEYEDLRNNITEINEQIEKTEKLKNDISIQLANIKIEFVNAQNKLEEMNGIIADKEKEINALENKLNNMTIEEKSLLTSCSSKRNDLDSLEEKISELGQKFEKMTSDCAALEMKYGVLKEFKEVEVTSQGVIDFMNKAQKGDKDSLYKYALCLKHGIGVKRNIELANKYLRMIISD